MIMMAFRKTENIITYCRVEIYLLATYTAHDVIAKAEGKNRNLTQPEYMSAIRYSEVLWKEVSRCGSVYEEKRWKEVFVKILHVSVKFSMRTYCREHKDETI